MRRNLAAAALLVALSSVQSLALAAPPLPEPTIPTPDPTPAPVTPPSGSPAASEPRTPSDAATTTPAGGDNGAFAPPPNLKKNPIDVLPPDVIYPPLDRGPRKSVLWSPEWARFSTADWIVTATGTALALGSAIVPPLKKHSFPNSTGFDDSMRKTLRLGTSEQRFAARDSSDVILSLEATWPFFVDALITTWWYRASPDAAGQMALVDGEALALVTAVQGVTNTVVSRERPYGHICGAKDPVTGITEQPDQTNDCQGNVRYRSFFSGHTAFTFMSAGLICVHHEKLDLFDGPGDEIACVTAYLGAAATGVFRMMGDMHYATDVLTGAGVGGLIGLAVPLLHYRRVNLAPQEKSAVDWRIMPVGSGVGVGGTF